MKKFKVWSILINGIIMLLFSLFFIFYRYFIIIFLDILGFI